MKPKDCLPILLIGFDGATFELLKPWADAGLLPTFRRVMKQGAWGSLNSTMPPVTPAAWSTLATGMNQGKHGLFDFFGRRNGGYESYLVNSTHRHGTPVWQLLSQANHRVTVFNVPATYPPDRVNGLMVSGLLTPADAADASYPPELLNELKGAVPHFGFYPPGIFSQGEESKFIEDVLAWDWMTLQATEFLMDKQPWDFMFTVFIGVDIVSHFMWRYMAQEDTGSKSDHQVSRALATGIQRVYQQADTILARLLEKVGSQVRVIIVSDHGFGPLDYYMHLNAWLAEKGYLRFKRDFPTQLRYIGYRLGIAPLRVLEMMRTLGLGGQVQQTASKHNEWLKDAVKRIFLSTGDIDWTRTTAFSTGYGGPIFVNLKGREAQGAVEPGAAYQALLARLTVDLKQLRHPLTGELFVDQVYRPQDLYRGPFLAQAPDLLFTPRDWSNQGYGVHDFASNQWLEPSPDRSGTHRMNGILLLTGPDIRPGSAVEGAALWDIAPTVLTLMGAPIPEAMDGQVLWDAFSEEVKSRLAITYTTVDTQSIVPNTLDAAEMSAEEEQIIRERLEALGYLS